MKNVILDNLIKDIFNYLDKEIDNETGVFIGLSGGADSMFLTYIIDKFFYENGYDYNQLNILHFDHCFRKESSNEKYKLTKYYCNYNFFTSSYEGNNFSEDSLRKSRYNFFENMIKQIGFKQNLLFLGHNIDDRIETTLLNLLRGSSLKGFINMSEKDFYKENIFICRPLIHIEKDVIKQLCYYFGIFNFEDATNSDISVSKRNYIRKNILSELKNISNVSNEGKNLFYESFRNIYSSLEYNNKNIYLKPLTLPDFLNLSENYILKEDITDIEHISIIFEKLGIYKDILSSTLEDFFNLLKYKPRGYKYFKGYFFIKSHGYIYIIKSNNKFWENKFEKTLKINNLGIYNFCGMSIEIDDKYYIGGIIRFPKNGDIFRGKTIKKYLKNNKVPFFIRNFVPIIEKKGQIKKVLYKTLMSWIT